MKMKALRWYGIHDVRTEEIDKPVPPEGEVLVRVLYAGICGSDLHIYNKGMFIQNVPETMGHEFCGVVEEADSESGFSAGDLVIANPMVPCGVCDSCRRGSYNTCEALGFIGEVRQGCFAKYISLPPDRLIPVPGRAETGGNGADTDSSPAASCGTDSASAVSSCGNDNASASSCGTDSASAASSRRDDMDLRQLALAEPLAVAVNVCERGALSPEDSLAVIGAGPIGLLTAALARNVYGVKDITVVNRSETRRKIAEQFGVKALPAIPDGQRFDKIVEAAGSPVTFNIALQSVRAGGLVLPVSVFEEDCVIDANLIVGAQLSIIGCNCYGRKELETAVNLIASRRVDLSPVITDVVSLDDGKAAFEKLSSREKRAAKILFEM